MVSQFFCGEKLTQIEIYKISVVKSRNSPINQSEFGFFISTKFSLISPRTNWSKTFSINSFRRIATVAAVAPRFNDKRDEYAER